jgi:hypothetical protein
MNRRAASIDEPTITALPQILRDFCGLGVIRQPVASRQRDSERDCNEIISDPYCRDNHKVILGAKSGGTV